MMICHYFSFLIDEIWLDWWDNILLFLFYALTELNLICGYGPSQSSGTDLWDLAGRASILSWPQGAWDAPLLWAWRVGR